jgi:hypothetical protein
MFSRDSCTTTTTTTTTPLQRQVPHTNKETENLLQTHAHAHEVVPAVDCQSQQNQESDSSDNTTQRPKIVKVT